MGFGFIVIEKFANKKESSSSNKQLGVEEGTSRSEKVGDPSPEETDRVLVIGVVVTFPILHKYL